jgi:hypothetical protein
MMDTTTGRWLSEDPDGFTAGDMNLYRYCKNSPTNATDPTGLEPQPDAPTIAEGLKHLGGGQLTPYIDRDPNSSIAYEMDRLVDPTTKPPVITLDSWKAALNEDPKRFAGFEVGDYYRIAGDQKTISAQQYSEYRTQLASGGSILSKSKVTEEQATDEFNRIGNHEFGGTVMSPLDWQLAGGNAKLFTKVSRGSDLITLDQYLDFRTGSTTEERSAKAIQDGADAAVKAIDAQVERLRPPPVRSPEKPKDIYYQRQIRFDIDSGFTFSERRDIEQATSRAYRKLQKAYVMLTKYWNDLRVLARYPRRGEVKEGEPSYLVEDSFTMLDSIATYYEEFIHESIKQHVEVRFEYIAKIKKILSEIDPKKDNAIAFTPDRSNKYEDEAPFTYIKYYFSPAGETIHVKNRFFGLAPDERANRIVHELGRRVGFDDEKGTNDPLRDAYLFDKTIAYLATKYDDRMRIVNNDDWRHPEKLHAVVLPSMTWDKRK